MNSRPAHAHIARIGLPVLPISAQRGQTCSEINKSCPSWRWPVRHSGAPERLNSALHRIASRVGRSPSDHEALAGPHRRFSGELPSGSQERTGHVDRVQRLGRLKRIPSAARSTHLSSLLCDLSVMSVRSSRLRILPMGFFGSASIRNQWRGTSYSASRRAQCACIAGTSRFAPGCATKQAATSSPKRGCGTAIAAASCTPGKRYNRQLCFWC